MISERHAYEYCKDDITKIENYERAKNDQNEMWDLHHQLELTVDGEFAHTGEELKRLGMYYQRPYFELIFLTHSEHVRLHMEGKAFSDEHRQKLSESKKGENHPMYGQHRSEETRQRISESLKGKPLSAERRQKISDAHKGRKRRPFTAEHRRKMSEAAKRRWLRVTD